MEINSRSASVPSTVPVPLFPCSIFLRTRVQTRFKKRKLPSTPASDHSRSFSGGDAKRINNRPVSAPYLSTSSSQDTMFPLDLDILAPSLTTIPWVKRLEKGSDTPQRPRSLMALVKNRA